MGFFGAGKRKRRLQEAGVDAPAQILDVQDTGVTVNQNPRIKLTLNVTPPDGSAAFQIATKKVVSRVAIPRAGDGFMIRFDPEDHDNFEIVGATASGEAQVDIDSASAGDLAAAASSNMGQVQRGSAAELLASGQ